MKDGNNMTNYFIFRIRNVVGNITGMQLWICAGTSPLEGTGNQI